jgi:hypothetical protein
MKQDVAVIFSRATTGLLTQQGIGTAGYPRAFGGAIDSSNSREHRPGPPTHPPAELGKPVGPV